MRRAFVLGVLLPVASTGCFKAPEVDEGLLCGEQNDFACPDGQSCDGDGVCRWQVDDSDASVVKFDAAIAAVDATVDYDAFNPSDCSQALPCPDAVGDTVSICGRLYEIRDGSDIRADGPSGEPCDPGATSGPCALALQLYDPISYASNPDTAVPLVPASLTVDDCGRFAAISVPRPAISLVSLHLDDTPTSGADDYVATARTIRVASGDTISGAGAIATTRATDQQWTSTAGNPFGGQTFSELGASVHWFLYRSEPRMGVTLTVDGVVEPTDDYYFNDGDAYTRNSIEPLATATGVNGTGITVNSSTSFHGGTGAEPAGCEWLELLSGAIPGLIHYVEHIPLEAGTETECL